MTILDLRLGTAVLTAGHRSLLGAKAVPVLVRAALRLWEEPEKESTEKRPEA